MDILVEPNDYMAGYSAIPIRIYDSGSTITEQYKYVINLLWDKKTINSITTGTFNGSSISVINFTTNHNFKVGDSIFIQDTNNNIDGYYIIRTIISPSSIGVSESITLGINPAYVSKVIKYTLRPDLEDEAKINLGNTIKDFLTENLEDVNEIYEAPNSVFDYNISIGSEERALFNFEDNIFVSGAKVGFLNTNISDPNSVPLSIGDSVYIQQNEVQWEYYDNFFNSGNVGFTSTTQSHSFRVGTSVFVTGQITNPQYNNFKTVTSVPDNNSIVVNEPFGSSSPVEGGIIRGVPRPEYNGNATILDIYYEPLLSGVVVVTDKTFTDSSVAIGGYIRSLFRENTPTYNIEQINGKKAYNARVSNLDYSVDYFPPYIIENVNISNPPYNNNICTILEGNYKFRIEQSTKSWLLVHKEPIKFGSVLGIPHFEFYDSSDTLLSKINLSGSTNLTDYHYPIGIDQLLNSNSVNVVSGSTLSAITDNIAYYKTFLEEPSIPQITTNPIFFELNTDCSKYDIYHLMWKDKLGSWISYPFIYIARNRTEVERRTYYQTEGNWDNNTFGYDSYGRGEKNYFSRSRDKLTLNSGWLEDEEVFLMKDLMESSSVYVQKPDNTLVACIIEENQIELKKEMNDQIFNYTFNVRLSNNDIRL